jgi:hypothetical protein
MKQIIISADTETHGLLKSLAKSESRTIGQQALVLLRASLGTKPARAARLLPQTNINHA